LTALRGGADRSLDDVLDEFVRELDAARASVKSIRGETRRAFLDRLGEIDRQLLAAARAHCDAATMRQLSAEAEAELAPFRDRMPADAYERSHAACVDRLIRERTRLPVVAFD
jgi:hypothetical protein